MELDVHKYAYTKLCIEKMRKEKERAQKRNWKKQSHTIIPKVQRFCVVIWFFFIVIVIGTK